MVTFFIIMVIKVLTNSQAHRERERELLREDREGERDREKAKIQRGRAEFPLPAIHCLLHQCSSVPVCHHLGPTAFSLLHFHINTQFFLQL